MEFLKGKSLFVVNSPFQCLCMLEAISYFKITDYNVLISYLDNTSTPMVEKLLKEKKIKYSKTHFNHIVKSIFPLIFKPHRRYKNIFLGYYYNYCDLAAAYIYGAFRGQIYYLDDGIQAYEIFSDNPRKRFRNTITFIIFLYKIIGMIKMMPKEKFFTIYDVQSKEIEIIRNPFNCLICTNEETRKDIYIIGTNTDIIKFSNHSYFDYLISINKIIRDKYPNDDVYYCPHRRDSNNSKIFNFCKQNGISIFHTTISVEYDFAITGIYPRIIIGFNSNALYTLHFMFKNAEVYTVEYDTIPETRNKETKLLRKKLNDVGIKSLQLF